MDDQTRNMLSSLSEQDKIEALFTMGISTSDMLDFLIQRIKNNAERVSEDMMLMDLMIARSNISSIGDAMTTVVRCERCGKALEPDRIVWLELDQRTGKYTDAEVPEEFSQGAFAFGVDCAKAELTGYGEEKVYSLLTQSESAGKAPTLSGLYNCLLCGEEKCRQPGICEDCLIPPSENDQTNKELT